jgi:O-methyltransferase
MKNEYLDLLERVLTFALWREPASFVKRQPSGRKWQRAVFRLLEAGIGRYGAEALWRHATPANDSRDGKIWPSMAHSMIGERRMRNVRMAVETVIRENVPGDLIETGVWRGGTCIFMRGILKAHGDTARKVFVADSFAGLPPPDPGKYPADRGDNLHTFRELAVSRAEVEENFRNFGLLDRQVEFVEGFFEHTLPKLSANRFSLMRLDGDMYSSTIQALEALYPALSPGGFCIIDDYALAGCRRAVDDFRARTGITAKMQKIDWTGMFWRKPEDHSAG